MSGIEDKVYELEKKVQELEKLINKKEELDFSVAHTFFLQSFRGERSRNIRNS